MSNVINITIRKIWKNTLKLRKIQYNCSDVSFSILNYIYNTFCSSEMFFKFIFLGVRCKVLTSNIKRSDKFKKGNRQKKKIKTIHCRSSENIHNIWNPYCMFTITDWIWNKSLKEYSDFRHTYAFQSINMNNISINEHKYLLMNRF